MTYDQDPARWTSSPDDAPELLRGAFSAARNEGPSQTQTRALALKIAALSAGGAVAIGTAKATAAGNVAASAATWSIGKLAGVIALVGTVATGAVVWQQGSQTDRKEPAAAVTNQRASTAEPGQEKPRAAVVAPVAGGEEAPAGPSTTMPRAEVAPAEAKQTARSADAREVARSGAADAVIEPALRSQPSVSRQETSREARATSQTGGATQSTRSAAAPKVASSASATKRASGEASSARPSRSAEVVSSSGTPAKISEVELLQRARGALRSRPREAYRLTEQHRQLYPAGEYAQERDALAIQALLGAGETEMARDLAVSFIKAHPSSPHAHRFREAMGIR